MQCPFPGMDPYIERPEIWPDFHDSLVAYIREALQPQLRPRYAALTQDRLYGVEHRRPIRPDVAIVRTPFEDGGVAVAVATRPDRPLVMEIVEEEICQPVIHIIEPAAGNRIVAAIEVLSPDNKAAGPGRDSYLRKREELWQADAHLIEIDLLRRGERWLRVEADELGDTSQWHYVVVVSRRPRYREFYPATLCERLPRIGVPLAAGDSDVTLDLQTAFSRCWQTGPYPTLLRYDKLPPGDLSEEDTAWCGQRLAAAGWAAT
jgi:Protein of unknown function (DUF4058)